MFESFKVMEKQHTKSEFLLFNTQTKIELVYND